MQEGTILSDEEETCIVEPPPNAMALLQWTGHFELNSNILYIKM